MIKRHGRSTALALSSLSLAACQLTRSRIPDHERVHDPRAARQLVAELTGQSWQRQFFGGVLRVSSEQFLRLFRAGPAHVGSPPAP